MIKNYPVIKVPSHINQDNSNMNLEDVQNYFDWFLSIKNERLLVFYKHVFLSENIEFSIDKLQAINYFFKDNINTKGRSINELEKEKRKIPNHLSLVHQVPNFKFVEPTFSIVFDIAIYYGELLMKEVEGLKWSVEKDFELVDYGYPIIVKDKSTTRLCPSWIMETLAKQLYEGNTHEDRMIALYKLWKNNFEGKSKDFLSMVEGWSKKNS